MKTLITLLLLTSCSSFDATPSQNCEEWNDYINDYYNIQIEEIKNGFEKLNKGVVKEIKLLEEKRDNKLKDCKIL